MIDPTPAGATPFQVLCFERLQAALAAHGLAFTSVVWVRTEDTPYLLCTLDRQEQRSEIFIYGDEAEIFYGRECWRLERPDYEREEQLGEDLLRRVTRLIETGSPLQGNEGLSLWARGKKALGRLFGERE